MDKVFRRFGVFTVVTVYLLIVVGGVVRSTGSGMGCPDWPKCFGQYVPPTAEDQLPPDYRELYAANRQEKNQKFAKLLTKLGYTQLADQITNDPSVYEHEPFNATKTWIEYLNRLLGALTGLFIFLTFVFSFAYWRRDRAVVWLSGLALVLVLFEAVLGALVVYTNLLPSTITVHMMGALAVVVVLIYAVARSNQAELPPLGPLAQPGKLRGLLLLNMGLFLAQVALGTQVREAVDGVAKALGDAARPEWIGQLGWEFYLHRTYSLLIFGLNFWAVWLLRRHATGANAAPLHTWGRAVVGLLAAEIATGAGMAYLAIPAVLQPLHLGLAALIFGAQFWLWLLLGRANAPLPENFQNREYAKSV
jgi:cytochrome c oxidase assembly protein subunit 15